ncbi:hypothetical protein AeNC1_000426, partial [Aphanomyces euteiches]
TTRTPGTGTPTTKTPGSNTPSPTGASPSTTGPSGNGPTTPATTKWSPPSDNIVYPCTPVSVEGDATYCITGPICSGNDASKGGDKCPKKGDVAIADCWKYLNSYADGGKCVAPVDAVCGKVKTGVWGCKWPTLSGPSPAPTSAPGTGPSSTPSATTPKPFTPTTPKPNATNSTNSTNSSHATIVFPKSL